MLKANQEYVGKSASVPERWERAIIEKWTRRPRLAFLCQFLPPLSDKENVEEVLLDGRAMHLFIDPFSLYKKFPSFFSWTIHWLALWESNRTKGRCDTQMSPAFEATLFWLERVFVTFSLLNSLVSCRGVYLFQLRLFVFPSIAFVFCHLHRGYAQLLFLALHFWYGK